LQSNCFHFQSHFSHLVGLYVIPKTPDLAIHPSPTAKVFVVYLL
jgi:hypothetical protein